MAWSSDEGSWKRVSVAFTLLNSTWSVCRAQHLWTQISDPTTPTCTAGTTAEKPLKRSETAEGESGTSLPNSHTLPFEIVSPLHISGVMGGRVDAYH